MTMRKTAAMLVVLALAVAVPVMAAEGAAPRGIPHLDHVFLIMMENHGFSQIFGNGNAPFINSLATSTNMATNYFAVAHPSLTNYLEVVGGSNFGVHADNAPDWHNATCVTNLASGQAATDNPSSPTICPISGTGTDAATPAIDTTNEVQGTPGENNIDGIQAIPAAANTIGKTIGDQLVEAHLSWKSYQESLPFAGADNVSTSDGVYTNNTDFSKIWPVLNPPLSSSDMVALYAVKHNPFAYFANVQDGTDPRNSLANTVGFSGAAGLYADLRSGRVPNFAFIVPNQCNDQHGRGNAGPFCAFDPNDDGSVGGLNPALITLGDVAVQQIVNAIWASPAWKTGSNAIVVVWDENDYSVAPNINRVLLIVETNYGVRGVVSAKPYNHFSLLRTLEAGFGLGCLNHACDANVNVMTDLFAR
jgi:hypothetical protein